VTATERQMRIDVHAHAFPDAFLRELAALYPSEVALSERNGTLIALWNKAPLPAFDANARLRAMDEEQVELELLSAPPLYTHFDEHTAKLCRGMNAFQVELAHRHPDRFRAFLHLPYHDAEATVRELEHWSEDPAISGVTLASNMAGVYPGDARLDYLWPLLIDAALPVFIHPVAPCGVSSPIALPVLHFPNDTAVAAASLIYAGVFDRHPALRVILPHYGGTLPLLAQRLDMLRHPHFPALPGVVCERAPSTYVASFYVDTAQGFHEAGLECARSVFGADHLLYGSDYFLLDTPWRRDLNAFLDRALSDERERAAILRGNATALLLQRDSRVARTERSTGEGIAYGAA
jgi:predicted TIM-barrel fold metal-dependent hydrolase